MKNRNIEFWLNYRGSLLALYVFKFPIFVQNLFYATFDRPFDIIRRFFKSG